MSEPKMLRPNIPPFFPNLPEGYRWRLARPRLSYWLHLEKRGLFGWRIVDSEGIVFGKRDVAEAERVAQDLYKRHWPQPDVNDLEAHLGVYE